VKTKEARMNPDTREPWAEVLTIGDARFGILVDGPFDGRCYPLLEGTPRVLDVPGPIGAGSPRTVRYVLLEGRYRYVEAPAVDAA
jgi:hypothetical protein